MSEKRGTKALELWCKRLVKDCPNAHIENMTTSWRNGIAFCALVHYFRPDLIDLSTLNPEDIYYNNQLAFSIAEKELGIPALLDPEDMVENDVPDRLSILTYLSQFYQRLGHTVSPKYVENEAKEVSVSPSLTPLSSVSRNFVKADLDKCAVCNESVYLAQRLIVSHKLYHRRCFRCSKCSVQLSPSSCPNIKGKSAICCDTCECETNTKYLNNNDVQMGMLAFSDADRTDETKEDDKFTGKPKARPLSVLDKISLFEKNNSKENNEEKLSEKSLKDAQIKDAQTEEVKPTILNNTDHGNDSPLTMPNLYNKVLTNKSIPFENETLNDTKKECDTTSLDSEQKITETLIYKVIPDDLYKSNINKFNFLQTQLSSDLLKDDSDVLKNNDTIKVLNETKLDKTEVLNGTELDVTNVFNVAKFDKTDVLKEATLDKTDVLNETKPDKTDVLNETELDKTNVLNEAKLDKTDVLNEAKLGTTEVFNENKLDKTDVLNETKLDKTDVSNEPKLGTTEVLNENKLDKTDVLNETKLDKSKVSVSEKDEDISIKSPTNITDDSRLAENDLSSNSSQLPKIAEVDEPVKTERRKITIPPRLKKSKKKQDKQVSERKEYPDDLNPFSDDDEEEVVGNSTKTNKVSTNPFGSSDEDDDDPSQKKRVIAANPFWSDGEEPSSDEETQDRSKMYCKSPITSSTPNLVSSRKKKSRAPPPPVIAITEVAHAGSMDDVASIASTSSFNSTINSDKYKLTPRSRKKKMAPTPPDNISNTSTHDAGTLEKDGTLSSLNESVCRRKGPAPGLPLPSRRAVRLLPPHQLQGQLDLLETQQLGLEKQGVLIEQMIRDKCEGEEGCSAPQEEVEELVIQLCELVNEKNDLFRKHTELMYIRRQQRLEQEQADIEHEIRVIQSRPAVNRMDSDKAREEQLVARLVETVRLRDALVQQLEAERTRERLEDRAIADSIASKRAQRNSDSNTSSMKSFEDIPTPKKNKIKDKVKKQLKKAKHTLHIKKKEDKDDVSKEKNTEKEHKSKWF